VAQVEISAAEEGASVAQVEISAAKEGACGTG